MILLEETNGGFSDDRFPLDNGGAKRSLRGISHKA